MCVRLREATTSSSLNEEPRLACAWTGVGGGGGGDSDGFAEEKRLADWEERFSG